MPYYDVQRPRIFSIIDIYNRAKICRAHRRARMRGHNYFINIMTALDDVKPAQLREPFVETSETRRRKRRELFDAARARDEPKAREKRNRQT